MSLVVKDLVSGYDQSSVDIIRDISLCATENKITGIIGPNGAGKSTLLKTIYGFLKPRRGTIYYGEKDITGIEPYLLARMGIAYIPQERCIFPELTVSENLRAYAWNFRKEKERVAKSIEEIYSLFPALKIKRDDKASCLSGGQQRMLEFSRALIQRAKFILLDEPTAGLAPIIAMEVYDAMKAFTAAGISLLFVDQNVRQAVALSDYIYMLMPGKIGEEGPKDKFLLNLDSLIHQWI
jgi:branched-chain amino acid transport system ATP-binding protein